MKKSECHKQISVKGSIFLFYPSPWPKAIWNGNYANDWVQCFVFKNIFPSLSSIHAISKTILLWAIFYKSEIKLEITLRKTFFFIFTLKKYLKINNFVIASIIRAFDAKWRKFSLQFKFFIRSKTFLFASDSFNAATLICTSRPDWWFQVFAVV